VTAADVPDGTLAGVARLARAAPPAAGRTRVVAVDGPSGSGKTTLAAALAVALGTPSGPAPVVRLDDFYPGWDGLEAVVPRLVEWVLEPVAAGRPARYRRWDWTAGRYAEWHQASPPEPGTLVVDGVGSGARACAPYLSLLVWVEAPRDVRYARGMARDGEAYRPWWDGWAAQEERHFAREGTRARAAVVVASGGPDPR
jgi:energy-coupling factor transporter ATP-binding protein EcfA2